MAPPRHGMFLPVPKLVNPYRFCMVSLFKKEGQGSSSYDRENLGKVWVF